MLHFHLWYRIEFDAIMISNMPIDANDEKSARIYWRYRSPQNWQIFRWEYHRATDRLQKHYNSTEILSIKYKTFAQDNQINTTIACSINVVDELSIKLSVDFRIVEQNLSSELIAFDQIYLWRFRYKQSFSFKQIVNNNSR